MAIKKEEEEEEKKNIKNTQKDVDTCYLQHFFPVSSSEYPL